MKNKFTLLALAMFIISCSNDDSNNPVNPAQEVTIEEGGTTPADDPDFMNDTAGNFWVYNTWSTQGNGRDSLYIANDTVISNTTYKKYKTGLPATGFYSAMMTGGAVRKADGKVMVTGNLNLNTGMGIPFNVNLENFVVYDENASANQQLSVKNETITQEMQGMQVSIAYILSSQAKEAVVNYTGVAGKTYASVNPVEIKLKMQVTVNFNGFPFPLLPMQDVVISTQYYTPQEGAVHITSQLQYELANLGALGIELPVPQSGNVQQQEILVNHNVQ